MKIKHAIIIVAFSCIATVFTLYGCADADKADQLTTMQERITELEADNAELRAELRELNIETVECGMCGAHVHEWYYLHDSNNYPVEVCKYCYQQALE